MGYAWGSPVLLEYLLRDSVSSRLAVSGELLESLLTKEVESLVASWRSASRKEVLGKILVKPRFVGWKRQRYYIDIVGLKK